MKKLLLLMVITALTESIVAQTFSGGVQTGAVLSFTKDQDNNRLRFTQGQNVAWNNGFFVRYDAKKRFAGELSFRHYYFRNDLSEKLTDPKVFDDRYVNYQYGEFINNYAVEVSVQYDITCNAFKSCKLFRNLESYIGLSVIPTLSHVRYSRLYEGGDFESEPLTYRSGSYNEYMLYTGLSHMLKYNLSRHIYFTSKASLSVDPFNAFSAYYRNNWGRPVLASWLIGAGYNF